MSDYPSGHVAYSQVAWWVVAFWGLMGAAACHTPKQTETLTFWAFGREGAQVAPLLEAFEATHPGIQVKLQQIPWSAAYEKLVTAYVGGQLPDVAQMGNSWLSQFVTLHALVELTPWIVRDRLDTADYFSGIWKTNRLSKGIYGLPWYVDTRVLFYRTDLLKQAGYATVPQTWAEWERLLHRLVAPPVNARFALALLPDWSPVVILGLQQGATLLGGNRRYGNFRDERFRRALAFYVRLVNARLVPHAEATQLGNLYQEFAQGQLAMFWSGPWSVGVLRAWLPDSLSRLWTTAPLPGPEGPGVSLAGGSSLVIFRNTRNPEAAWALVRFFAQPEVQLQFYLLTGNLPPRRSVWQQEILQRDEQLAGFGQQLERIQPLPAVPEWEAIAARIYYYAEATARGLLGLDEALARLDQEVDRILEKRRRIGAELR